MSEIYSGLASFGKVQSVIGFVVVGLIFIVMISIGGYLVASNSKYKKTLATISIVNCQLVNTKYNCDANIKYIIDSKEYNTTIKIEGLANDLKINDVIDIEYNSSSPTTIRQTSNLNQYLGWILIAIAFVILILGIVSTILVFKYKPYAAYTGIKSILPNISAPIGGGLVPTINFK
jgi:hypothetical protein